MATITPAVPGIAGATVTRVATTPAGDVVSYPGGDLLLHFENGHDSSITVSVAPTRTTVNVDDVGPVSVPTRSVVIAAGAEAVMLFKAGQIGAYLNGSRQVPLAYTGGDADLTAMALRV